MFEFVAGDLDANPLCEGNVELEGTNEVVAAIFARNPHLMAPQLAPMLLNAAAKDPKVAERIQAMGPDARFSYSLSPGRRSGKRVLFPVKIYQR